MLTELTISKETTKEAAFDQAQLYQLGLKRVQDLAKQVWTDFNTHDPGITTLETLCYALTDLSYRASMPITDLLASENNNASNMQQQFFTAREILHNRPITLLDYRKLLIDLKGVKNAWIKPTSLTYYADTINKRLLAKDSGEPGITPVPVSGLHNVLIDYMDGLNITEKRVVLNNVKAVLHANRNLCEDFVSIIEVKSQDFILCSEIELQQDADAACVKAQILFNVQQFLTPTVANYTLSEMLEKRDTTGEPYTADRIFNGPPLHCGFIPDEELVNADLPEEIRLSDIINIIMDIPGVMAIGEIQINPLALTTTLENKWIIPIEDGKKVALRQDKSRLVFRKQGLPIIAKQNKVNSYYAALSQAAKAKLENEENYNFKIPLGRYRNPRSYYAFQNHMPAIYGISDVGLPANTSETQKAQAMQLKAYLLFFEQLMANYLAQLAKVRQLFSTNPALTRTYHYQAVDSFKKWDQIYNSSNPIQTIENHIEDKAILIDRRNRFLDHLISRFAEQFSEFANIMYASFDSTPEMLADYKCNFINSYPAISSERGLAYNYTLSENSDIWNSRNISGLEERLSKLLGITNSTRRNLSDIHFDIYAEIDTTPGDEFRFRVRHKIDNSILISSSRNYATEADAKAEMRIAILAASNTFGFSRKVASNGRFYFNIVDETGKTVARRIEYFNTEQEVDNAIHEVMHYLRINYTEEGLYLIENILLRPDKKDDPFLPICINNKDQNSADNDPYSYRIQIILPAYGTRFSNMEFRNYAEQVIRAEVPAHILPKICWIDKDDMVVVERTYLEWLKLKCRRTRARRKLKIGRFIRTLYRVKNVYPTERLHECSSEEAQSKFIIGNKALGSLNSSSGANSKRGQGI